MEAGELRRLRRESRDEEKEKGPKKSNFVRFFESLENRGPMTIHSQYERWARAVRAEMETEGTWPTLEQECDVTIIAEYVSRLQRQFWNEHPELKWYEASIQRVIYEGSDTMRPSLRTLKRIYKKIRHKGMRDRSFTLSLWRGLDTPTWAYITYLGHTGRGETINIKPYTPFNDYGADI